MVVNQVAQGKGLISTRDSPAVRIRASYQVGRARQGEGWKGGYWSTKVKGGREDIGALR